MAVIVSATLSSRMLPDGASASITTISREDARRLLRNAITVIACVGHRDTAEVVAEELGYYARRPVDPADWRGPKVTALYRRVDVTAMNEDTILVAEYVGPRLPEGATSLPEGATIRWRGVHVTAPGERRRGAEERAFLDDLAFADRVKEGRVGMAHRQ